MAGKEQGRRLGIAAPDRSAAEAGADAFRSGGNAFDAALAAALSLTVTFPDNCALGGDLIAMVRRASDGRRAVINASGRAARATDVEALRTRWQSMPVDGAATVTVPGLVGGLREVWNFGAVRSWDAAFDVAIAQAEHGVPVAPTLAESIRREAARVAADPGLAATFLAGGKPLSAGTALRQPALARSLRALADEPDALYGGEMGTRLLTCLRGYGSALDEADLAAFAPIVCEPLVMRIGGQDVATAPPNSQGFGLLSILAGAEQAGDAEALLGERSGHLAGLFHRAVRDRDRHLCDPEFASIPLEALLEPGHAHEPEPTGQTRGRGDTVAVVCADEEGNSVSLIQSVFHTFGAGILDPLTGIILHNRGASFSLDPASPNVLAPGKRPAHTLTPCTVFEDGRPATVAGTMGGSGQPQILAQVLLQLRRGARAQEAVSAPRFVVGGAEADAPRDLLQIEAGIPSDTRRALLATHYPRRLLGELDDEVGHAQVVTLTRDGVIDAGSDPRTQGAGLVVSG
jgi:gamma-glutamyltranspeptidase/glutathione hydrolase